MDLSPLKSSVAVLALAGGSATACNAILAIDPPILKGTGGQSGGAGGSTASSSGASTSSVATGTGGIGAGGGGGTGGTGGAPLCASPTPFDISVVEDGSIPSGACNGAIDFCTLPIANIGGGAGLFKFPVPGALALAFQQQRVVALSMTLTRAKDANDGGQCPHPCPAAAGTITARPLRNDWAEGASSMSYSGADWCRRLKGNPGPQWGMNGATESGVDVLGISGSAPVDATQLTVTIPLDPAVHAPMVDTYLSVRIEGAVFVVNTHENNDATLQPAHLTGSYCP